MQAVEPDLIISSTDGVHFAVHRCMLEDTSIDGTVGRFSSGRPSVEEPITNAISVAETSAVLQILLFTVYNITPPPDVMFTVADLVEAVEKMELYDMLPASFVVPNCVLYDLLLAHAPHTPMDIYSLAGKYDLFVLATAVSPHLLTYPLHTIDDKTAVRMGATLLNRLFKLQLMRMSVLRRLVFDPPVGHAPTVLCSGEEDMGRLLKAWALGVRSLIWDASPGTSISFIQHTFERTGAEINCPDCEAMYVKHINNVSIKWASVKRTI